MRPWCSIHSDERPTQRPARTGTYTTTDDAIGDLLRMRVTHLRRFVGACLAGPRVECCLPSPPSARLAALGEVRMQQLLETACVRSNRRVERARSPASASSTRSTREALHACLLDAGEFDLIRCSGAGSRAVTYRRVVPPPATAAVTVGRRCRRRGQLCSSRTRQLRRRSRYGLSRRGLRNRRRGTAGWWGRRRSHRPWRT